MCIVFMAILLFLKLSSRPCKTTLTVIRIDLQNKHNSYLHTQKLQQSNVERKYLNALFG